MNVSYGGIAVTRNAEPNPTHKWASEARIPQSAGIPVRRLAVVALGIELAVVWTTLLMICFAFAIWKVEFLPAGHIRNIENLWPVLSKCWPQL